MRAMGERSVGQEVIARLVTKLGGVEKAARRLGIRPGLVQRFLDGSVQVPDQVMLKALDFVNEANDAAPVVLPEFKGPRGKPVI